MPPRFVAREIGPTTIAVLVVAQGILWLVARPIGEPAGSYLGQLLGAESILLLSIGLVLISMLPWVEGVVRRDPGSHVVRLRQHLLGVGLDEWTIKSIEAERFEFDRREYVAALGFDGI